MEKNGALRCSLSSTLRNWRAGRPVSYYVDPEALPKVRRKALLGALKAIHGLRKRAHLEFTAHLF